MRNVNASNEHDVLISKYYIEKLQALAELMEDVEVWTVSLSKQGEHANVLHDFFIPPQTVSPDETRIEGETHIAMYKPLMEQGFFIRGIAHSHGSHDVWHSIQDNTTLDQLLEEFRDHTPGDEYLDFRFEPVYEGTNPILRGFNYTDIDLDFDPDKFSPEELQKIQDHMRARLLMRVKGEVSSIVINQRGDVFGLKRFYDDPVLWLPGQEEDYSKIRADQDSDFREENGVMKYSIPTSVRVVDSGEYQDVDRQELIEEIRQKVKFETAKPSCLEEVVDTTDMEITKFAKVLVRYAHKLNPHSGWVSQLLYSMDDNPSILTNLRGFEEPLRYKSLSTNKYRHYEELLVRALRNELPRNNTLKEMIGYFAKETAGWTLRKNRILTRTLEEYIPRILHERSQVALIDNSPKHYLGIVQDTADSELLNNISIELQLQLGLMDASHPNFSGLRQAHKLAKIKIYQQEHIRE